MGQTCLLACIDGCRIQSEVGHHTQLLEVQHRRVYNRFAGVVASNLVEHNLIHSWVGRSLVVGGRKEHYCIEVADRCCKELPVVAEDKDCIRPVVLVLF